MTPATLPIPAKDVLPEELTHEDVKRWVIWRNRDGSKKPYRANAPYDGASSTNPEHWTHFDDAVEKAQRYNVGVGFVFAEGDGYAGIDLDKCLNERGELAPWAAEILRLAGKTYAEVSPSGRGIKVWVRGSMPGGKGIRFILPDGSGGIEAYSTGRYFTVTGRRWNDAPLVIGDGSQAIAHIVALAERERAHTKGRKKEHTKQAHTNGYANGLTNGHANGHTNGVQFPAIVKAATSGEGIMLSYVERVRNAQEGNRNNTLNEAGYTLGGLLASGAITKEEGGVYAGMLFHAALKAGLPDKEALSTLEHSIERGYQRPFDPDKWEAPIPLPDEDAPTAPDFPLHALPDAFRRYVQEIATTMQVDPAMPAMAGLAVVSGALCGTTRIAARRGAQIEQPGLYVAVVAPTGDRKSAVLKHILEPVAAHEREVREAAKERERSLKALRGELAEAKRAKDEGKVAELQNRVRDLEYESERALSRELLVTDATSQALSAMLNKNGGRALVASAEGDFVEHVGGRYNDGNPDLNIYLSGYSADPLRILRKERNEFVEAPSLAVLQMMQPARLREFLRIPTVIQRGLAARMLITLPKSNIGERSYYPPNVAYTAKSTIEAKIRAMLAADVYAYDNQRQVISISQEGESVLEEWHNETEALLARNDLDETLRNWLTRAVGHAIRLANVIYHLRDERKDEFHLHIEAEDVKAGVTLAKYCLEHLKAALNVKNGSDEIELARVVVNWIIQEEKTEITTRDVYRKLNGRSAVKSAQDVAQVMGVLEEFRYIRRCERERRGGRPSERWLVNPLVFAEQEV